MPAPDYETCYNVTGALVPAIVSVLSNAVTATIYGNFDEDSKTGTPWIEANYEQGTPTGHYGFDQAGVPIRDAWNSTLTLRVCTNRKDATQDGSAIIATIRETLQNYQDAFGTDVLPYHGIVDLRESGSSPATREAEDLDVSEISFSFITNIRASAWPDV